VLANSRPGANPHSWTPIDQHCRTLHKGDAAPIPRTRHSSMNTSTNPFSSLGASAYSRRGEGARVEASHIALRHRLRVPHKVSPERIAKGCSHLTYGSRAGAAVKRPSTHCPVASASAGSSIHYSSSRRFKPSGKNCVEISRRPYHGELTKVERNTSCANWRPSQTKGCRACLEWHSSGRSHRGMPRLFRCSRLCRCR